MNCKRWFLVAFILPALLGTSAHAAAKADQVPGFSVQEYCVAWVRGCVAPTYKLLSESAKYSGILVQYDGFASWSGRGLAIYPTLEAACHSLNGMGILVDEPLVSEDIRQYVSANGVARLLVSAVFEVNRAGALGSMLGILRNQDGESTAHLSDMTHNLLIEPALVKGQIVEGVHYKKISPPSCDVYGVALKQGGGVAGVADIALDVVNEDGVLKLALANLGNKDAVLMNPFGFVILPGVSGMDFVVVDGDGSKVSRCAFVTPGVSGGEVTLRSGEVMSSMVSLSSLAHLYCLDGKYKVRAVVRHCAEGAGRCDEWSSGEVDVEILRSEG